MRSTTRSYMDKNNNYFINPILSSVHNTNNTLYEVCIFLENVHECMQFNKYNLDREVNKYSQF